MKSLSRSDLTFVLLRLIVTVAALLTAVSCSKPAEKTEATNRVNPAPTQPAEVEVIEVAESPADAAEPMVSILSLLKPLSDAERVAVILEHYEKFKANANLEVTTRQPPCDEPATALKLTHLTDGSGHHEVVSELNGAEGSAVKSHLFYEGDSLLLRAEGPFGSDTEHHYFYDDRQIACEKSGQRAKVPASCELRYNMPIDTRGENDAWDTQGGLDEFERRRHAGVFARPLRAFLGGHDYSTGLAEACSNEKAVISQIKADFGFVKKTVPNSIKETVSFSLDCKADMPPCIVGGETMEHGNTLFQIHPTSTQVEATFAKNGSGYVVLKRRGLFQSGDRKPVGGMYKGTVDEERREIYYKNGLPFFVFITSQSSNMKVNDKKLVKMDSWGAHEERLYLRNGTPIRCLYKSDGGANKPEECSKIGSKAWDVSGWLYDFYKAGTLKTYLTGGQYQRCQKIANSLAEEHEQDCFQMKNEEDRARHQAQWEATVDAETQCMGGYTFCPNYQGQGPECIPDGDECS